MGRLTASLLVAALAGICAISVPAGAQVDSSQCAGSTTQPADTSTTALAASARCLINAERSAGGRGSLGVANPLTTAANRQLNDLLSNGFLDHIGSDGSTIVSRTKQSGFIQKKLKKWTVGEILAYGAGTAGTPSAIVTAWMNSPTHRRVIMHSDFRFDAIAVGRGTASPGGTAATTAATYVGVFGFKKNK